MPSRWAGVGLSATDRRVADAAALVDRATAEAPAPADVTAMEEVVEPHAADTIPAEALAVGTLIVAQMQALIGASVRDELRVANASVAAL